METLKVVNSGWPISQKAQEDMVLAVDKMAKDANMLFNGNGRDYVYDIPSDSALWKRLEKQTIAQYLAPYHPDVTTMWGARVGGGFGGTANDISALVLVAWYRGNPSIPNAKLIKGGNHLLAEEMLKDCQQFGAKLVLEREVTEISQHGKNVKVRCRNGQDYSADYVVVTIPAYAANKVIKGLNSKKRKALQAVKYNPITEVGLHIKNFPKSDKVAALMFIGGNIAAYINQTGEVTGHLDVGTVIVVTIMNSKMQHLPDKQLIANIAQELKVVSPSLNLENDVLEYVIKRWTIGEVHVTPGFLSKYQNTLMARAGNIYFAGEYVSNFPTWGGAVWAGSKAAEEVLVAMGKQ